MTNTVTADIHTIQVCTDCLMVIANNDFSGVEDHVRIAEVVAGICDWADEGYILVPGDDSDAFSRQRCECCKTPMAGERHDVTALKP